LFSSSALASVELLLNRRHHEVDEDDAVRHAVQAEAMVKLLRDGGRTPYFMAQQAMADAS